MWTLCDIPATEIGRITPLGPGGPGAAFSAAPVVEAGQNYFAVGPVGL
jgi:hypothetical protein